MLSELAPDFLLSAYAHGIFPMADDEGEICWFAPDPRAGPSVAQVLMGTLTLIGRIVHCASMPAGTDVPRRFGRGR